MSWGANVPGVICLGGKCLGGKCPKEHMSREQLSMGANVGGQMSGGQTTGGKCPAPNLTYHLADFMKLGAFRPKRPPQLRYDPSNLL